MKFLNRKTFVTALTVAVLAAMAPAQAGNDTSWIPTDKNYYEPTMHSFAFTDKLPLPFLLSVMQGDSYPNFYVCKSTNDSACAQSKILKYNSILKVCENATEMDCISSVTGFDSANGSLNGTFTRYTVTNHVNHYPADPVAGIPEGSMPSIWSIPGASHASGIDYAVVAGINGNTDRNGNETVFGSFMQLSLIPVVLKDFGKGRQSLAEGWHGSDPGIFYDHCVTFQQTDHNVNTDCGHANGDSCLLPTNDQGMCYAEEPFGQIQKFNIQLRLSKEPSGWMHGRMVDPTIAISKLSTGGINLSVTAGTTTVPMVYQTGAWASLPSNVQNLWLECHVDQRLCGEAGAFRGPNAASNWNDLATTAEGNSKINLLQYVLPFGPLPLKIMSTIAPLIGDKSQASSTTWSMRTLAPNEMNGVNRCFTSTPGLKGIVSTNSTTYSAGPPEFKDGSLNYQVSSPHFNPDGTTPFKGNYNLVMRSDVARCIYGFSSAPIKASISVLSSDGSNDVATTVAAEKDGWISLSANNFQFSAPIIQVKFTQDAPVVTPVVAPTVAPTTAPVVKPTIKQITITCVKGKNAKKVTAVKPACPKGFVKK